MRGRMLLAAALCVPSAPAICQSRWSLQADLVYLGETDPSGFNYVNERGLRLRGDYTRVLPSSGGLSFEYRGGVYGSLVNHQGADPTRTVIPAGTENLNQVGQVGTRHALRMTAARAALRPFAQLEADLWYRPLSYYEIWIVPQLRFGGALIGRSASLEAGFVQTLSPRVRTETTRPPWNADRNTTLHLGNTLQPFFSLAFPMGNGAEAGLSFERYRFGASPAVGLSSGIAVFQPATVIESLGFFYRTPLR